MTLPPAGPWKFVVLLGWMGKAMADSPGMVLPWEKLERQLQWGLYDSLRISTDSALARPMNSRDSARLPRIWLYRGAALYGLGYSDAARECFQTAACMDSNVTLDSFYVQSELPAFYGNIRLEMAEGKIACPEREDSVPVATMAEVPKPALIEPLPTWDQFRNVKKISLGFWAATAVLGGWMIWEIDGRQKSWDLYSDAGAQGDTSEYDKQGKIFAGHNARTWISAAAMSLTAAGGTFFTLKAMGMKRKLRMTWTGNSLQLAVRF